MTFSSQDENEYEGRCAELNETAWRPTFSETYGTGNSSGYDYLNSTVIVMSREI